MLTLERKASYLSDRWRDAAKTFGVINPATGESFAEIADCGPAEAQEAIGVAVRAFESWRAKTPFERAEVLARWQSLILAHRDELARTMTLEMGKPITEARGEVSYAAGFVGWYAEEAKRVYGETVASPAAHKRLLVIKQPVGPVYAVTPWNFPAAMVTRKAAPALAAGCSFVLKPAEQTPLSALKLAALWEEAGGLGGTLQVLPTSEPGPLSDVFLEDERVRKISFTGSTEVGRMLYEKAAKTVKKVSLELGGHAPFIVFGDADLDKAVREVMACKFRNAGQTCVCTNRIYVQNSILDAFTERYAEAARGLKVGDPLDERTQIGPLVNAQGLAKVKAHVADALARGARVVTGGKATGGLYFEPTVLSGVTPEMQLMQEETFGPVAPILSFGADEEAVRAANSTPYGLAAYFYTRDLARAFRVAESLDYGIVGVNDGMPSVPHAPFGGMKQSGVGREGGKWGLEEYLEVKYISLGLS
ncbi:MAG: NAD-dependent succinate-semialdehyde dehydrogenase [Deinococcota bacterium]|nr:NAD-dependent succinate-semialdehyde dehydrogenase [Deinococcota bacterium]